MSTRYKIEDHTEYFVSYKGCPIFGWGRLYEPSVVAARSEA
jgi:hypothetical protein